MVLAKSKKNVGLGNSLMNDRFSGGKGSDRKKTSAIRKTGVNGESYVTDGPKQDSWHRMRSVTEQAALDEFLATAELADTDFTAEKMNNIQVIHTDRHNPYLLSKMEERSTIKKQKSNKAKLTVPRRPKWDTKTTADELDKLERESFLEWRRGLAELQETKDLLMTPFERNLEVWRQLWRVIERCQLVVQIVDARSPMLFRCEDLEAYVKEVDSEKRNLLLVNKADLLTLKQRQAWAEFFVANKISYRFFSAALAKETNELNAELEKKKEVQEGESEEEDEEDAAEHESEEDSEEEEDEDEEHSEESESDAELPSVVAKLSLDRVPNADEDEKTRILTVEELEELFLRFSPEHDSDDEEESKQRIQIGLVGYPNVGKSSTINALIGAKKVSVSSTPGKTKHFQTIHLSDSVILCDCPGLVFPNFANTKADLVCNGVLPIDQLREFTGPAELVARRIPQRILEGTYGIKIDVKPAEEGGDGIPTGSELLIAYAKARGFAKTGVGEPDESRAARYILKDYVRGRLLWCSPPAADPEIDSAKFNAEHYENPVLPKLHSLPKDGTSSSKPRRSRKAAAMDERFFAAQGRTTAITQQPFHSKYSQQAQESGKQMSGRKLKLLAGLNGVEVPVNSKKHFKGGRRVKGKAVVDE